jgi:beta-phosphoglucomutase-like phosphatase (HAD superfamily)
VARGKPEPDLFLHAAQRMGASAADCLVIEDSVHGVTAARRADMVVFGFTGGAHAQGQDYNARLVEAGAVVVFDEMLELPGLVDDWRRSALHESAL